MILFLASNIGGVKKENGKKYPVRFFEKNSFLNNLKKNLTNTKKFVLVASDPDNYDKNDLFLKMDIEALKLSDLCFDEYLVLDQRNTWDIENVLKDASLIFLSGGNTLLQNKFFNSINLKSLDVKNILKLKIKVDEILPNIENCINDNSVVIGISAGSINSAKDAYNSPESEEDLNNSPYLHGLELTNINIEPHFSLSNLNDDSKKIQTKAILSESNKRILYGLTDGAYIIKTSSKCMLYGESYKIQNGIIKKICNDDEVINIDYNV